jgi:RNA-directed DNA polymerase
MPLNVVVDGQAMEEVEKLLGKLPGSIWDLDFLLNRHQATRSYDPLVQRANAFIWQRRRDLWNSQWRLALARYSVSHLPFQGRQIVLRRLAKDPDRSVRRWVNDYLEKHAIPEVALPDRRDGTWDVTGWRHGTRGPHERPQHRSGAVIQERSGVPILLNVRDVRELLGIRSPQQLGYLLLASDAKGGPYKRFTVAKRQGGERVICAPGRALRYVQRNILDKILSAVTPHAAAHGFVNGRSTVTNASPHCGAELVLKFDLEDFFPTIHGYRVLGMFGRLGYEIDNGRFSTDDDATHVAPVLARLCCYTDQPRASGIGVMPQGAPTSPAISNLVCRGLDARLHGLAERMGGAYTRYADDLTFSFGEATLDVGRFRWWVDQVCHQEGFYVNESKFRVLRRGQRQSITGIVVNDGIHLPRRLRRQLRAIVHNCRKYGVASQARGRDNFLDWLSGQAAYLHMVEPEAGEELLADIAELRRGST